MEVRFSGSISYNNKLTDKMSAPITPHKNELEEGAELGTLRSNVELKNLERRGISVSTGEEQIIKALDRALKALEGPSTTFEVSIHKQTKAIMVKVLNKETGEVIREIPPEKTLDLVASMMEIAGIMVDKRV